MMTNHIPRWNKEAKPHNHNAPPWWLQYKGSSLCVCLLYRQFADVWYKNDGPTSIARFHWTGCNDAQNKNAHCSLRADSHFLSIQPASDFFQYAPFDDDSFLPVDWSLHPENKEDWIEWHLPDPIGHLVCVDLRSWWDAKKKYRHSIEPIAQLLITLRHQSWTG